MGSFLPNILAFANVGSMTLNMAIILTSLWARAGDDKVLLDSKRSAQVDHQSTKLRKLKLQGRASPMLTNKNLDSTVSLIVNEETWMLSIDKDLLLIEEISKMRQNLLLDFTKSSAQIRDMQKPI